METQNTDNNLFGAIVAPSTPAVETPPETPTPPVEDVTQPDPWEEVVSNEDVPPVNFTEKYPTMNNEVYGDEAEALVVATRQKGDLTLTFPGLNVRQYDDFGKIIETTLERLTNLKELHERHQQLLRENKPVGADEWQKLAEDALAFGIENVANIDINAINNERGRVEEGFAEEVRTIEALHYAHRDETFYDAEGSSRKKDFQQFIKADNGMELHSLIPNSVLPKPRMNQPLTGKAAVLRVQAMMGMAGNINIPLWHSGFWITLRTPNDMELINFYKKTAEASAEIGRVTNGLALSNNQGYIISDLFELVVTCMERCTLEPSLWEDKRDIGKYIRLNDMETLAWGLACCMYPKGFQFTRNAFIKNESKPDGRELVPVTGTLNLRRTFWVDKSVLSDEQIKFMSNVTDSVVTEEDLARYLSGFKTGYNPKRTITMKDDPDTNTRITIDIGIPTVKDAIRATDEWVALLSAAVDRVSAITIDELDGEEVRIEKQRKRRQTLEDYANKLPLTQYSAWFQQMNLYSVAQDGSESIEYISERTSILATLTALPMEVMRNNDTVEKVMDFNRDATFALMATPTISDMDESPSSRFKHLVPINPIVLFFILCHWRVGT